MHQQTQSPFDHERETSVLPAPIDLRAFLPPSPQTIPLRLTVRRLDADQVFRAPDTHDHFMETKLSCLDTTEEPARALWKHGPTFSRLDVRYEMLPVKVEK